MAASYIKGKYRLLGTNRLTDPAHLKRKHYPYLNGRHCELHIFLRAQRLGFSLKGGTLYITGARANNNNQMQTTAPCSHCRTVISETQIRHLVYWLDGELIKEII